MRFSADAVHADIKAIDQEVMTEDAMTDTELILDIAEWFVTSITYSKVYRSLTLLLDKERIFMKPIGRLKL
jgi:hypothetical protein